MRSTKASNAVDRLKKRTNNPLYSMTLSGGGMFCLVLASDSGENNRLCEPMQLEEFVTFVNAYGPQIPKRVSKLDIEFGKQLQKKN